MAIGSLDSTGGLLTILFTEVALLIIFHGPIGAMILEPIYGSNHILHGAAEVGAGALEVGH